MHCALHAAPCVCAHTVHTRDDHVHPHGAHARRPCAPTWCAHKMTMSTHTVRTRDDHVHPHGDWDGNAFQPNCAVTAVTALSGARLTPPSL
eukprot:365129-Chlamydomonas_euryale.AAC.15